MEVRFQGKANNRYRLCFILPEREREDDRTEEAQSSSDYVRHLLLEFDTVQFSLSRF